MFVTSYVDQPFDSHTIEKPLRGTENGVRRVYEIVPRDRQDDVPYGTYSDISLLNFGSNGQLTVPLVLIVCLDYLKSSSLRTDKDTLAIEKIQEALNVFLD